MNRVFPLALLLAFTGIAIADEAANKKYLKDLEGNYTATSMTRSGEKAPDEFLSTITLSIKGDTFTIKFKKGDEGEEKNATVVIDAGKKPVTIDLTPKVGPEAGKPILGIIKVEKDTVTYCWADRADNVDRPKDFTSTKENKFFMIVMKKAK
jgi:uncharacterized protein (TIGR03067 family)